jgi:hypothetical protein
MRKYTCLLSLLSILSFSAACITDSGNTFASFSGSSEDASTEVSTESESDESAEITDSSELSSEAEAEVSSDDGGLLDVTWPETDVMIDEDKCNKVDFLFVIDDSGSMNEEQASLIASFPGFINGVLNLVPSIESFHLGVTTVSMPVGNPVECQQQGALVTSTFLSGINSSQSVCGPYVDGYNFMTNSDDLAVAFPCAAQVGTMGGGAEQPIKATVEALDLFINSPGQCNEDFSRDDALLVIVMITDEDDQSGGVVENWFDELIWLKGAEENIVVLSLCQTEYCQMISGNTWNNTSEDLVDFTNMFTNGFVGDVCAPNYDSFFNEAMGVIQTACGPIID